MAGHVTVDETAAAGGGTSRRHLVRAAGGAVGALAGGGLLTVLGAGPAGAGPRAIYDASLALNGTELVRVEQAGVLKAATTGAIAAVPSSYTPTTAIDGQGVLGKTAHDWNVAVGSNLNLFNFNARNLDTVQGGSQFNIFQMSTDTDAIDTGSAFHIRNKGKSDAVYIAMEGKPGLSPGADNAPSGLAVDMNRFNGTSGENSPNNRGTGLNIWDWSTTNQGLDGPRAAHFRKQGNPNSDHRLLHLYGNRRLLHIETADGSGYDGNQPVVDLVDRGAVEIKWRLTADGDQLIGNGRGLYFNMSAGNQSYVASSGTELQIRAGSTGLKFLTNTGLATFGLEAGGHPCWMHGTMVQATVGAAGAASALPAAPTKYLKVVDDTGAVLVIPAYRSA